MFALVAAFVFIGSFLLAAGTIVGMLMLYHDKMVAALTFEPIPREVPVYRLRISRRRAAPSTRRAVPVLAAALAACRSGRLLARPLPPHPGVGEHATGVEGAVEGGRKSVGWGKS